MLSPYFLCELMNDRNIICFYFIKAGSHQANKRDFKNSTSKLSLIRKKLKHTQPFKTTAVDKASSILYKSGFLSNKLKLFTMTIASRIRKIREIRGWKQTAVALSMNITQQGYSCLEQGASNARLETLKRFCDVMNVDLPFLVAVDVPVTAETLVAFGEKNYNEFLTTYKKLEQKIEIFDELLKGNFSSSTKSNHIASGITPTFSHSRVKVG